MARSQVLPFQETKTPVAKSFICSEAMHCFCLFDGGHGTKNQTYDLTFARQPLTLLSYIPGHITSLYPVCKETFLGLWSCSQPCWVCSLDHAGSVEPLCGFGAWLPSACLSWKEGLMACFQRSGRGPRKMMLDV